MSLKDVLKLFSVDSKALCESNNDRYYPPTQILVLNVFLIEHQVTIHKFWKISSQITLLELRTILQILSNFVKDHALMLTMTLMVVVNISEINSEQFPGSLSYQSVEEITNINDIFLARELQRKVECYLSEMLLWILH